MKKLLEQNPDLSNFENQNLREIITLNKIDAMI